jgi:hypothetical protein
VWPALFLEVNTGFRALLKMPWGSLHHHQELINHETFWCTSVAYFHPEQKFTFRDICMMQRGGMTNVTGRVLAACTGVCCQNMNKWLWNAVCSDVPKFCVRPGKWKLGESKNGGLSAI